MDSKELVELRNLIATAQLPWRAALCDVVRDDPNDDEPWTVAHCGPGEGMEAVIVGAVNALPSLLDHIAAQDARIEALEGALLHIVALCPASTGGMSDVALSGLLSIINERAEAALGGEQHGG